MRKVKDSLKKNCWNCEALEWGEGEYCDPSGWICTHKTIDSEKQEERMLKQMESEEFMARGKKCCQFKQELK